VVQQGGIGENTFHVPPEEYRAPDRASLETDRMLASLCNRWQRETALRLPPGKLLQKASGRLSKAVRAVKARAGAMQTLAVQFEKHKREQQQLRRRLDYLTAGQEMTRTGSWAWNPASGELFWSPEHFRIFGLDAARGNVSYQCFFQMIHLDERAGVERKFQEVVRTQGDFDGEYRIVRPDGVLRHIRSRAHPVFGRFGELIEYVGTVVDITERRHGEESLSRMQEELARVSRAIILRQLMSSIAHEVKQPLAAITINSNAALRWLSGSTPRIDKTRQALLRIASDGRRANEVITRIRILVTGIEPERNPLILNFVIREVIALLRTELRRNNIEVRTDLAENLPPIRGDRVQLQQVLLNLITNAIEAMRAIITRPRLLAISTMSDAAGVVVAVEDCGSGLDDQVLECVFEPFYTTKPQGMGIGLAISRSIIDAHGGRLWPARNPMFGATFKIQLPLDGADAS
jgi:PAS domain S-box-containing protein